MSSSVPVQQGGVVMVTPMYPTPPQGGSVGNPIRQHMIGLGAVQIMIGVIVFFFGVVALVGSFSFAAITGFFAWGTAQYIIAGSLTVAAGKSTSRCLMITALVFNIFACLFACAGLIVYAVDAAVMYYHTCDDEMCDLYEITMQGMGGVLSVLHFLEFIITIVAASFAGKFCCSCCKQQQQQQQLPVYIVPGNTSMAPQAPPTYSPPPNTMVQLPPQMTIISNPATEQTFPGIVNPPSYSSEPAEEIRKF